MLTKILVVSTLLVLPPATSHAGPLAPSGPAPGSLLADAGDDQYQFLVGLCEKRLWDLAVKEGRSFLSDHPGHGKVDLARYRLATALFELDRRDEAEGEYAALARVPGFEYATEASFRQGQCALERGDAQAAVVAFERAASMPKDYLVVPVTFFLAESLFRLERYDEAGTRYEEVLVADPRGEYAREAEYGAVWCAFRGARHEEVLERARRFERTYASREGADEWVGEIAFLRGESLLALGRAEDALEAYRDARRGAHADSALRGTAFALSEAGRHRAAAQAFEALLAEHPESRHVAEAALHAGIEHLRNQDADAARRALEDERVERTGEALYWLAQARRQGGDASAALVALDEALRARPDPELAERLQVSRGDALTDLGRAEEAQGAYQAAGNEYGLYAAAVSALNGGRHTEAGQLAGRLIGEYPESSYRADALLVIGESLLAEGKHQAARSAFEKLLGDSGSETSLAHASTRAAWCSFLAGELGPAAEAFGATAARWPDAPESEEALYMCGRAHEAAGHPEAAVEAWKRWERRYPEGAKRSEVLLGLARLEPGERGARWLAQVLDESPEGAAAEEALFRLGETLADEGRRREAAGAYARLLELAPDGEFARPAHYGLAWCLYDDGDPEGAERALQPLLADREAPADLLLAAHELAVWTAARRGDAGAATRAWSSFAEHCEDDARALAALQVALAACRRAGEPAVGQPALEAFLKRVRDRALASEALVEAVWLSLDAGQAPAAEKALRSALRVAPEEARVGESGRALAEAAFFVGEAHYTAGDHALAAELYDLAAPMAEAELAARVAYKRGFAALVQEDLAAAEVAFARLAADHEDSELWAEGLYLLGETRSRREDFAGAIEPLTRLVRDAPRYEARSKALFRLGVAHGHQAEWRATEQALTELLRREPSFEQRAEAQLWRGRALAARQEARGARSAFQSVIDDNRGALGARARLELGHLARAGGDVEGALSEYLKVGVLYAHEPSVAEALYLSGRCLEELGDEESARQRYREVLEQHPEQAAAKLARERLRE